MSLTINEIEGPEWRFWFLKKQYYGTPHYVTTHIFRNQIPLRMQLLVKKISFENVRKMHPDPLSNWAVWTN